MWKMNDKINSSGAKTQTVYMHLVLHRRRVEVVNVNGIRMECPECLMVLLVPSNCMRRKCPRMKWHPQINWSEIVRGGSRPPTDTSATKMLPNSKYT